VEVDPHLCRLFNQYMTLTGKWIQTQELQQRLPPVLHLGHD